MLWNLAARIIVAVPAAMTKNAHVMLWYRRRAVGSAALAVQKRMVMIATVVPMLMITRRTISGCVPRLRKPNVTWNATVRTATIAGNRCCFSFAFACPLPVNIPFLKTPAAITARCR